MKPTMMELEVGDHHGGDVDDDGTASRDDGGVAEAGRRGQRRVAAVSTELKACKVFI